MWIFRQLQKSIALLVTISMPPLTTSWTCRSLSNFENIVCFDYFTHSIDHIDTFIYYHLSIIENICEKDKEDIIIIENMCIWINEMGPVLIKMNFFRNYFLPPNVLLFCN